MNRLNSFEKAASPSEIHRRFIASYYHAALQREERRPSEKSKPVVSRVAE
jgi:hypothetical protein